MADIVVSNAGELFMLRRMLHLSTRDDATIKLGVYVNDYTPNKDTLLADLTEAAWGGYAKVPLTPADWTEPVTLEGAAASFFTSGPVLFTPASGVTIAYGAFVVNAAGTVLIWSWRFDSPQTVTSSAPCVVNVSLETRSESEPDPP